MNCAPISCREQRSDRVLADVVKHLSGHTLPLDASEIVVVARDGGLLVLDRLIAAPALCTMGLDGMLEAANAARRPNTVPCVIVIDGEACVAFVDVVPLAQGGSC